MLSFVILDNTYPQFNPFHIILNDNYSKEDIKKGVKKLIKLYKSEKNYIFDEFYEEFLEKNIQNNIVEDLFHVQQYVSNFCNSFYCIVFGLNNPDCIVQSKGFPKRIYKWEN